jgi:hypothetical protein
MFNVLIFNSNVIVEFYILSLIHGNVLLNKCVYHAYTLLPRVIHKRVPLLLAFYLVPAQALCEN